MNNEALAKEAKALIEAGYHRISNTGRIVSRIDRDDWRQFMAQQHSRSEKIGRDWGIALGRSAENHYRRCYSKDKLVLQEKLYRMIPGS